MASGAAPNVILDNACKFTVQEDIVIGVGGTGTDGRPGRGPIAVRTPLADVYKAWQQAETNHMNDVRDVIEARADTVIRAEKEKGQREER